MDPQLKAIETIDRNLAVNAGAGTGKTKVLTERFINILEHGNLSQGKEIESVVAITFTKKATEEMIERIRSLIKDNFDKSSKWRRYYREMGKANISTIHSFCGKILRENPVEAGIDPLFEVLEDYTSKELLMTSIDKVLNNHLANNPIFYKTILDFGINRVENICSDYIALYNSIRTLGISFEEVKDTTMNNLKKLKVNKEDIELIKEKALYLIGKSTKRAKIYKFKEDENWIKFIANDYSDNELFTLLEALKDNIGTNKKEIDIIEELNEAINKVLKVKDGNFTDAYEVILDTLMEIDNVYSNEKKKISGLDYDDLQIKVLNLLDNKQILNRYQEKYKYIMIDEFQDTNELQKRIFYKLSTVNQPLDRNNLFVVGDPKQSIYAFRGADINVFYKVLDDVNNISQDSIITLEKNYRSVNTVLNFINGIFEKLMTRGYDRLDPVKESKNEIDIEVLENENIEDTEEATIFEARLVAKRIKQIVDEGEFDYRDIALLFRSTTRNFYYEEALKEYGIPFHNSSSKRYFYRKEILDIINGLKAISNPYDSISMIGFLRGPMVGLSDDTVFYLLANKDRNIYETMKKVRDIGLGEKEDIKLNNAYNLLNYFHSIKDVSTISHVLRELLEKTNFLELQLLQEHGKQSLANINKFRTIAEEFDMMNNKTLESFIDYIEKIRLEDTSEGVISSDNTVNLLTIHKSKGLQFPVVIIPELAKDIPNRFPRFLYEKESGIGIRFNDCRGIYDEIRLNENKKLNEEKKRVIYVAMTRAENKLILGNLGKDKGYKKMLKDYLNIEEYNLIDSIDLESDNNTKILELIDSNKSENIKLDVYPNLTDINEVMGTGFNKFSISQFLTYKECRRKFYFSHINNLDFPETKSDRNRDVIISGMDKGNIIHKFCQVYEETQEDKRLLEDITQSYGIEFNDSIYEELKPYIKNFKKYYKNRYEIVYIEKPFNIKIQNYYMSGVIDRININDDGIEIVDLKTNKLYNKKELIEYYTPQLRFYAYVVGKILNQKVKKSSIIFLENGEKVDIDICKDKIEDTISQLQEFFNFVENNKGMNLYDKSDDCTECSYNNFCNQVELS